MKKIIKLSSIYFIIHIFSPLYVKSTNINSTFDVSVLTDIDKKCDIEYNGESYDNSFIFFSHKLVENFKKVVVSRDKNSIASVMSYPIRIGTFPYVIKTKEEFLERFEEFFDEELINIIVNTPIKELEGSKFFWIERHLVCHGIWLVPDNYDDLDILCLNNLGVQVIYYTNKKQLAKEKSIILKNKLSIHKTLRDFEENICIGECFRIDRLGDWSYRLAIWKPNHSTLEKPDLVLYNGEMKYSSSSALHKALFFRNKDYVFYVYLPYGWSYGASFNIYLDPKHMIENDPFFRESESQELEEINLEDFFKDH